MHRKYSRRLAGLIVAVAFGALAVPASALATSTTVTPTGDSFSLGSSTVNIDVPSTFVGGKCTISGGTGTVPTSPANHNASGPVTVNLSTNPKFSSCVWGYLGFPESYVNPMSVFAFEKWSVTLQSGAPATAKVNIPTSGLRVQYGDSTGCSGSNVSATSLGGTWTNGTTSPLVISKMGLAGAFHVNWGGIKCTWSEQPNPVEVSGATVGVTDTTNGANVIKVTT